MNKIFKIIWNKTTQRLEVVSELAKSQGKATASTDKRAEVTSAVRFKKSALLTAISLALGLVAAPSFAASFSDFYAKDWSMAFGKGNQYGGRITDITWPIVVGADNKLMPNNDQATFGDPASATVVGRENNITKGMEFSIFGDRNELHAGNMSTVIGMRNRITNTGSNNNRYLTTVGNNIVVTNPSKDGLYIGNNIDANASPLSIGNNVLTQAGGVGIGYDIELKARHANQTQYHVIPGTNTQEPTGIALGGNIKGFGDNVYLGRSITLKPTTEDGKNVANQATQNNRNSVYVGHNITTKGAINSVLMGQGITSNDDQGHHSVAFGTNITLGSTNSQTEDLTAIGSHINITTNAKRSVAVGSKVNVSAEDAVAIGTSASAKNTNAVAIGNNASAAKQGDVVLGAESVTTTSTNSDLSAWTVSGANLTASYAASVKQTDGKGVVSVGSDTVKRQIKNVAAGNVTDTSTDAVNGAQLYALSTKVGLFKIKVGSANTELTSSTDNPIKFTSENANLVVSATTADNTVKFKLNDNLSVTTVTASSGITAGGIEVGKNNVALNAKNHKITGLTDAELSASSTEAVTGKQLKQTNDNVTAAANTANSALSKATALENQTGYLHVNSAKTGNKGKYNEAAGATGTDSVAIGPNVTASATGSIAIGDETKAQYEYSIALGNNASASGLNSTVIGRNAIANRNNNDAIVVGTNATSGSTSTVVIGKEAKASGLSSISIGQESNSTHSGAVALGYQVSATNVSATAIGTGAIASNVSTTAIGVSANASGSSGTAVGTQANATAGSCCIRSKSKCNSSCFCSTGLSSASNRRVGCSSRS